MTPTFSLLILCWLGQSVADYDPRYYEDLYDLDEYDSAAYMAEDADLLDDTFGYGAYDFDGYAGYSDDNYFYFSDEYDEYYDTYGFDAGYEFDYFGMDIPPQDCQEDENGEAVLQDEACDLEISGVDKVAKGKIPGGIDGTYKISGCFEGFPLYKREGKTQNDTRVLWYSHVFEDWDLQVGDGVMNMSPPLMYSGSKTLEKRPNFLKPDEWNLIIDPSNPDGTSTYVPVKVQVKCAGDKQIKKPETITSKLTQPVLTNEDSDAVYRSIYSQSGQDANPSVNFAMIILMALLGSSVVMGVPYLLKSKRANGKTLAQSLEDQRKQRVGHMN